jgi:SH3-like domain-containing protein
MMRGRLTFIAAGAAVVFGAMLMIPGGDPQVAVAEIPSVSSQETIATIDAMLNPPAPPALPERARPKLAVPELDPDNFQTAALNSPADIEAPVVDPNLRPDTIGSSAVNLRAGPSSSTSTITVLQPGQAVQVGQMDDGWAEITLPDGFTGWVYSRYLAGVAATLPPPEPEQPTLPTEDSTTAKADIKGKGKIEGRTARIDASIAARSIPASTARVVFTTQPGERVKIIDVRGKWLRIVTADGSSGWIQAG